MIDYDQKMEIIDETKEAERIQKVNGLLQRVFGKRTQGNLMDYDRTPLPEIDELHFIATGMKLPILYKIVGQFPRGGDGSEIRVLPEYQEKAENYAQLYEQTFGKKTTVTVDPNADAGTPCF